MNLNRSVAAVGAHEVRAAVREAREILARRQGSMSPKAVQGGGAVRETRVCPHCGGEWPVFGFYSHVRACERRPARGELAEMHRSGLSIAKIAARLGVSGYSVAKWMREEGYDPSGGRKRADFLETFPDLAPLFGEVRGCEYCLAAVRGVCKRLALEVGWVLCEAPDAGQMKRRRVNLGVDLGRVIGLVGQDLRKDR